jgi:hypothetical protein
MHQDRVPLHRRQGFPVDHEISFALIVIIELISKAPNGRLCHLEDFHFFDQIFPLGFNSVALAEGGSMLFRVLNHVLSYA